MDNRRRQLLRTAGIALTAGLAGCTGSGDGDGDGESGGGSPDSDGDGGGDNDDSGSGGGSGSGSSEETETTDTSETETTEQTAAEPSLSGLSVAIDNVSVRAWEVVEDESGSTAPLNQENPTMTFEVGQRYVIENRGWDVHPSAIRAADDTPLLSQSADGRFEDDGDVDWVDNGGTIAFTFTESLATAADYYICTVHAQMRGDVASA